MSEQILKYRLITLNGMALDFKSALSFEQLWSIIKGDGFLQFASAPNQPRKRIPFHAIVHLEELDPEAPALAYAMPASSARN